MLIFLCETRFLTRLVPIFPVAPITITLTFSPSLATSFAASVAIDTDVLERAVSVLMRFAQAIAA